MLLASGTLKILKRESSSLFEYQKGENQFGALLFVSFYQPITVIKEPFFLFNLEELNNRHNTLINKDKGNGVTNEETGHQWVSHHD